MTTEAHADLVARLEQFLMKNAHQSDALFSDDRALLREAIAALTASPSGHINDQVPGLPAVPLPHEAQVTRVTRDKRLKKFQSDYFDEHPSEISQLAADGMIVVIDCLARIEELQREVAAQQAPPVVTAGSPQQCPTCDGDGQVVVGEHRVTRDMASDAGEPSMEGAFHSYEMGPCEDWGRAGQLLPVVTAGSQETADRCGGCGGPYQFDTTIPSDIWNRVVRPLGGSEYLCATCILTIFAERGESFTAELWSTRIEAFAGLPISVTVGRSPVADPASDLRTLIEKWRAEAESYGVFAVTASVAINDCADDLEAVLRRREDPK